MHKKFFKETLTSFMLILCILLSLMLPVGRSTIVAIEMETDKKIYDVGDQICVYGNVTADGTPVSDALVAIEIYSPYNLPYLIRTVPTGENPTGYWKVQILDLYTCDQQGNPKQTFNKGSFAYVYIEFKNFDVVAHHVKVALYIQCSDNTPLIAFYPSESDVEAECTVQLIVSIPISSDVPSGEATVYANLYTMSPKEGGTPYCPEASTNFYIESTIPTAPPQPQYFNIIFKLPRTNVKLGNYTIYARSQYKQSLATKIIGFEVILLGDIVKDGKIDMRDIGKVCSLFGTKEGDPEWNKAADLYPDGQINMRDIGIECNNFGKTAVY